jgi:hypothetical protein
MENETKQPEVHLVLKKLWEEGIPVKSAIFQAEVDNANGTPHIKYDLASNNRERRVEMVWTPQGLICRDKREYWLVPPSNVRSTRFA